MLFLLLLKILMMNELIYENTCLCLFVCLCICGCLNVCVSVHISIIVMTITATFILTIMDKNTKKKNTKKESNKDKVCLVLEINIHVPTDAKDCHTVHELSKDTAILACTRSHQAAGMKPALALLLLLTHSLGSYC